MVEGSWQDQFSQDGKKFLEDFQDLKFATELFPHYCLCLSRLDAFFQLKI